MQFVAYLGHLVATGIGVVAIYWLARYRSSVPKWSIGLIAIGIIAFEAVSFRITFPSVPFWDFVLCYYPAGKAAFNYDIPTLQMLYERVVQGFVNIPVVAYLFAPFAFFEANTAALIYTGLGVAAAGAAWFVLCRLTQLGNPERWVLALLFLANGPLLNSLKFSNTSHFILLMLATGLLWLRAGRSTAAGVLLGAATVLKPAFLLFGVFFLLRRDVRGMLGFAIAGIATGLLSLALFGWDLNLFWFNTSILQFSHQWFSTFSVQSIPGFILRLRTDSEILTSWRPLIPTPGEQFAAKALVGLLYLVAAAACIKGWRRSRSAGATEAGSQRDLQYLLVVCLCVVSSPLSWSHYYVWLLMPAAFFLGAQSSLSQTPAVRWLGWLAITLVTPLVVWPLTLSNPDLMTVYRTLVVSHPLFGGLLWFGLVTWWLASGWPKSAPAPSTKALLSAG